jgi:hypothetical protein
MALFSGQISRLLSRSLKPRPHFKGKQGNVLTDVSVHQKSDIHVARAIATDAVTHLPGKQVRAIHGFY